MATTPRRVPLLAGVLLLAAPADAAGPPPGLFATSDQCSACHNGLVTRSGVDVSIAIDWRAGVMANSSRDPYWQAAVSREVADHPEVRPEIEDTCSTCHMPMSRFTAHARGAKGQIFAHLPFGGGAQEPDPLAEDGVSCSLCHQIEDKAFGQKESYNGGFAIDVAHPPGQRPEYGPFEVRRGLARIMESATQFVPAESSHVRQSELCATCHTLYTESYRGREVIARFAEQVPYLEWQHSAYREKASCQSCHMPVPDSPAPIASVLGFERADFAQHTFFGGNFLLLAILNRYRDELAVEALPQELDRMRRGTLEFLQGRTAAVHLTSRGRAKGSVEIDVAVENLTGHKLPTAYPSRRVWIHFTATDARGRVLFESGRLLDDGSIAGNDNDADARAYEPHYRRIEQPEQVQIYEPILASVEGAVTTGLLTATHYAKDNRLLPHGFDKRTAGADFAVVGSARDDPDFAGGGDHVIYVVQSGDAPRPLRVEVELWYQPIGFRWAMNHVDYPQPESRRFVSYYRSVASASAVRLANAKLEVP
jgi:hypothetical protein